MFSQCVSMHDFSRKRQDGKCIRWRTGVMRETAAASCEHATRGVEPWPSPLGQSRRALIDAPSQGADYGADSLQKGADIGAHGFAAGGYNLPRSATKTATRIGFDAGARESQRFDVSGDARRKRNREGRLRRCVNALCQARPGGFEPPTLGSEAWRRVVVSV